MAIPQSAGRRLDAATSGEGPALQAADLVAAIPDGRGVRLDGAVVEGDLDLDGAEVPHRLSLTNTVFLGHVHLTEARFSHTVDLSGCEFRQNLNLFGARVDGQLKLARARIFQGSRPPIRHNFDQIEVKGRLNATLLRSEVSLSFRQSRLGEIGFDGIQIDGDLDLQIAVVTGDVFCQSLEAARSNVEGCFRMVGLRVGGHVDLCGIRIGEGLDASNAEIEGDFLCQPIRGCRPEVLGGMSLFGARMGGQVGLRGLRAGREEEPRTGLNLGSTEIGRGLLICPDGEFRPEILGGIFGVSARISHVFVIDRALVGGDIDLQRAVVNGRMLCASDSDASSRQVPGHLEVRGRLDLSGAHVQELVLDGRLFDPPDHPEPAADSRRRRRERRRDFFRRMITGREESDVEEARLKLDRARLSKLSILVRIPDRISADGLTFDDLDLPSCEGECEYTELLRRTRPFKRSTYLAVEGWLHNKGLDEPARRVYLEMSDRDLVTGRSSLLGRWMKWLFLGVAIGYGARPHRLIALFLVAFALSCWVFSQPGSLVSYSERPAATPDLLPLEARNAWVTLGVALRCHFPMLLFLGEPNYVPSPQGIPGLGLRYDAYALLISAISWVLVPLFLAGLTGIVRQRK